jgi:hypothetical protein
MVPRQNRQEESPEHIDLLRRIGTVVRQRTVPHPGRKQMSRFQKFDEKGQLAQGRHGRVGIPFHVDATPIRIDGKRNGR